MEIFEFFMLGTFGALGGIMALFWWWTRHVTDDRICVLSGGVARWKKYRADEKADEVTVGKGDNEQSWDVKGAPHYKRRMWHGGWQYFRFAIPDFPALLPGPTGDFKGSAEIHAAAGKTTVIKSALNHGQINLNWKLVIVAIVALVIVAVALGLFGHGATVVQPAATNVTVQIPPELLNRTVLVP